MSTGIILRIIGELKGIARNNWKLKEHNIDWSLNIIIAS